MGKWSHMGKMDEKRSKSEKVENLVKQSRKPLFRVEGQEFGPAENRILSYFRTEMDLGVAWWEPGSPQTAGGRL